MKPDFVLVELLKACAKKKDIYEGTKLHSHILKDGLLEKSPYIASTLMSMYSKCGDLGKAQKVFDDLHARDVISWNALISGYAQHGRFHEALSCFEKMQQDGISPDGITFTCIFKACSSLRAIDKGKQIHDEIVRRGLLEKHVALGNALVDMYAKCGLLAKAHQILKELPIRNEVSWSTLISRYAQEGQGQEALDCFEEMQRDGINPDGITFICILQACGSVGAIDRGTKTHKDIVDRGLLKKNTNLGNALVDMYVKCGVLDRARQVLEELSHRDVVSWTSIIGGYAQQGQGHEALNCFEQMQREGIAPNQVTFISILKACASIGAADKGEQIHDEIARRGLLERNVVIGNALIDMYAKCGVLGKAQVVLKQLHVRDIISWNALIAGYAQHEHGEEALNCFIQIQREGLSPNEITFTCILKACGSIGAIEKGKEIHNEIVTRGLLQKNVVLGTALVDMYAKCSRIAKAQEVLENLPCRDIVSWNALLSGYSQEGRGHEALNCFEHMQREGLFPNEFSFSCILKACGSIGAIAKGIQVHNEIANRGLLDQSVVLGNSLVDMYAKCGAPAKARQVLEELRIRDSVSWAALIAGYAEEGLCEEALNAFEQMQREGFHPNDVTLLCVLNACSHAGKLDKAQMYYDDMSKRYGITPKLEHHTCMVAIFGSAGCFDQAMSVIKTMPFSDHPSVWLALLGSCRKWGNVKLGRLAFDRGIQLGGDLAGFCVLMGNLYVEMGMHDEAKKIESIRVRDSSSRKAGMSVGVNGISRDVHSLSVGNGNHSQIEGICSKMKGISLESSKEGYPTSVSSKFRSVPLDVTVGHNEDLTVAHGLLNIHKVESLDSLNNQCISYELPFSDIIHIEKHTTKDYG